MTNDLFALHCIAVEFVAMHFPWVFGAFTWEGGAFTRMDMFWIMDSFLVGFGSVHFHLLFQQLPSISGLRSICTGLSIYGRII